MGALANKMIFQPTPSTYSSDSPGLIWLDVAYSTQPVPAFFVPHPEAEFTILFSHGNAEDLGCIFDWLHELSYHLKVNVLAYDYAGYGQSGNSPDEEKCYMAIMAAFKWLTQHMLIPVESIVCFGRSLGGGPSCELARRQPRLGGLILQCTFTSVMRVILGASRTWTLPGDMFSNGDKLPDIKCPVLVIHGHRDEVIPFSHGKALHALAVTVVEPLWIAEAGHNNIEIYWKQSLLNRITIFLHEIMAAAGPPCHLESPSPSLAPSEPPSCREGVIDIHTSPLCISSVVEPEADDSPERVLPPALQQLSPPSPCETAAAAQPSPIHNSPVGEASAEPAVAVEQESLRAKPDLPPVRQPSVSPSSTSST